MKENEVILQKRHDKTLCKNEDVPITDIVAVHPLRNQALGSLQIKCSNLMAFLCEQTFVQVSIRTHANYDDNH